MIKHIGVYNFLQKCNVVYYNWFLIEDFLVKFQPIMLVIESIVLDVMCDTALNNIVSCFEK